MESEIDVSFIFCLSLIRPIKAINNCSWSYNKLVLLFSGLSDQVFVISYVRLLTEGVCYMREGVCFRDYSHPILHFINVSSIWLSDAYWGHVLIIDHLNLNVRWLVFWRLVFGILWISCIIPIIPNHWEIQVNVQFVVVHNQLSSFRTPYFIVIVREVHEQRIYQHVTDETSKVNPSAPHKKLTTNNQ